MTGNEYLIHLIISRIFPNKLIFLCNTLFKIIFWEKTYNASSNLIGSFFATFSVRLQRYHLMISNKKKKLTTTRGKKPIISSTQSSLIPQNYYLNK